MFSNYKLGTVVSEHDHCDHKHTCVTPGFAQTDDYGNIIRFQWTPDARFTFEVTSDSWIPVPGSSIALTQSGQLPDDVATVCDTYAYNTVDYRCWKNDCGTWLEQPDIYIDSNSSTSLLFSDTSKSTRVVIKNFREEVIRTFESASNTVTINVDDELAEQLLQGYYNMDVYLVGNTSIRRIRRIGISIGNYTEDSDNCDSDCHKPVPIIPNPSLENEQKNSWELSRATISVASIAERDSLDVASLPHGKVVRVTDTDEGVMYYSWDKVTSTWVEERFHCSVVDEELDATSDKPIQNKAVTKALEDAKFTPDWNENDSSKKEYIKGRTHYVEDGIVTLYDDTPTWTSTTIDSLGCGNTNYTHYLSNLSFPDRYKSLSDLPEEFDVVLGDTTYKFPLCKGNYSSVNSLVDYRVEVYPGVYMALAYTNWGRHVLVLYATLDIVDNNTRIKLLIEGSVYKTLDDRFIPNTVVRYEDLPSYVQMYSKQSDWDVFNSTDKRYICNRTHGIVLGYFNVYQNSSPSYSGEGELGYELYTEIDCHISEDYPITTASVDINANDNYYISTGVAVHDINEVYPGHTLWHNCNQCGKLLIARGARKYIDKWVQPIYIYSTNPLTQITLRLYMPGPKTLDEKYIPSTIARSSTIEPVILTTEEIDQLINKLDVNSSGD